ncbi:uncharacterized protein [Physcomitrium patens]|uniref:uncharacterized protein isoform X2 n=1 Tax=Physcomitrium patens TaxID=3218 RepID=UPI003CCD282E
MQIGIAKTPGHGPNGITLSPRLIDVARALSACTALNHVHTRLTRNFIVSSRYAARILLCQFGTGYVVKCQIPDGPR